MISRLFGVGIAGTTLTDSERKILTRYPPWAVILFKRNIQSPGQLRHLVGEIAVWDPVVCIDQEGGTVDRLKDLLGPSLSFGEAAAAGLSRRAGELAGEACARFGVHVNLAPVVDRCVPGASQIVLRDRCASPDPERVSDAGREFLEGLHSQGVGGCLKHFPGLGRADLDTHRDLPWLEESPEEEALDLVPFEQTMEVAGAVMVSHAAGPNGRPASLSRGTVHGLLRERLGFSGAVFSDDLEMGALSAFGGLPDRCAAAAEAGCDLLFACRQIEEFPECVDKVASEVSPERHAQAGRKLRGYADRLQAVRGAARVAARPLEDLIADIRALRESVSGTSFEPGPAPSRAQG